MSDGHDWRQDDKARADHPRDVAQVTDWSKQLWTCASGEELIRSFVGLLIGNFTCQALSSFRVQVKGNKLSLHQGPQPAPTGGERLRVFDQTFCEQLRHHLITLAEQGEASEGVHSLVCGDEQVQLACFGELKYGGYVCVWAPTPGGGDDLPLLEILVRLVQNESRWYRKLDSTEALLYIDELTSLFNYRYLDIALDSELRRASRFQQNFSLLFIDLDNFKDVNDRHGHLAGSAVLRQVGVLLKEELREVDTIIRYGGDEYVVILLGAPTHTGALVAERIRARMATSPLQADGHAITVTSSIGVASYPEHGRDKETLLRIADETMYLSKREGKNRVTVVNTLETRHDKHKRVMTISS